MKSDRSRGKFREAFSKEKIMRFLDKQGFYIILFVCIVIIGVTAFMTSGKNQQPEEIADKNKVIDQPQMAKNVEKTHTQKETEKAKVEDSIPIKVKDSETKPSKTNEDEQTKETLASNSSKKAEDTKKEDAPKKQEGTEKKKAPGVSMIYPVQGNVFKGHTMDELAYSNTLKEWTTHPGMDIEAFVGAEVKAAMGGTVEEIFEDPLMGIGIIIDHGKGLKTYYANLSTSNMVSTGQKVDKGQIISGVGRTASAEILDNPHLHFEVRLDGKSVDPKNYIK